MAVTQSQNENFDSEVLAQLSDKGLSPEVISEHQRNVSSFIKASASRFFSISDTCRIDNGGILALPKITSNLLHDLARQLDCPLVAFVPAAGASSRYLAPLAGLMRALTTRSRVDVMAAIHELTGQGLAAAPLPPMAQKLLSEARDNRLSDRWLDVESYADKLLAELDVPKALYPAVPSGETFLEVKRHEHLAIGAVQAEIYVTPPGRVEEFLNTAQKVSSQVPVCCYEQGAALSTTRFDGAGRLVRSNSDGGVSLVPGGHGTLIRLFGRVLRDFSNARGLFIRNIDNVSGTSPDVLNATRTFLASFRFTLKVVDDIRAALRADNNRLAAAHADSLLEFWKVPRESSHDPLVTIQKRLFHSSACNLKDMSQLFARPLVLMGQVPNTGNDVGGSCVFATVDGVKQKLCLELPHASPDDKRKFLDDHAKATHFNPVFVAAELPSAEMLRQMEKNPFWLVTKKTWEGQDVYYQESILYELLGSSQYTNAVFVEVPRFLFNPHKTLADAKGRRFSDWIPAK